MLYLCRHLKTEFRQKGERIFAHGDKSTDLYFIMRGNVAITLPNPSFKDNKQRPGSGSNS